LISIGPCLCLRGQAGTDQGRLQEHRYASATAMFEGQDGLISHLEFDDSAKFGRFAEYWRAHGLLRVDRIQTKSDKVH
jgi:hypothetical protein